MNDYNYVHVDLLKPGDMINFSPIKNKESENFLILKIVTHEVTWTTILTVLDSEGEKDSLVFPISHASEEIEKVRVYCQEYQVCSL